MPTASARLIISLRGSTVPDAPRDGELGRTLENGSGGARWTHGQAVGQIDRVYQADAVLTAAASKSHDLLAAGLLKDVIDQLIDLDELKAISLVCLTGSIKIVAPAANFLPIFGAAGDFIALSAGQTMAFDFGAGGLVFALNSKFDIVDTFGGSGSTFSLMFVGSN